MRQMKEMIVAQRNELEKRTLATQMVQRELNQAQDEIKQLKCDLTDQQNKHQEEKFKLLNQTKHMIEAHKAERDKQKRYVQEIQSNLDCVTEENRALLQESERLHSQLKSQDVAIECLRKQLTEAENESLQKSENWESAKQTLLKEKEEVQSKLARSESQKNLLLKKMTQIQLGMNNVKIEMSEVMKTSDELRDKLRDETQQKVLLEDQIKHRDQLVQQLKDEIHQSEGERHLLEEQVNHRDQLVQQLKENPQSEENAIFWRSRAPSSGGAGQPQRPTGPKLKDEIHQSERERHLLEEQVNHRDQLVQKLREEIHQSDGERHLMEEQNCALKQEQRRAEELRYMLEEENCAQKQGLKKVEEQRQLLEEQNCAQRQQLKKAEELRHLLEEQKSSQEQKLSRAEEQRQLLEKEKNSQEQELHRAEEQLHLLEKKNLTQDQELSRAEEQRHQLERMCVVLEQRLEQKRRKWYRRLLCC
ncbi:hypothetical protein WMY93_022463 [Mugilogobius chulae]|uniref:Uncharacterized protein n=1 Tax=Mugilogobius chulae TaxID=88201 RepID=A0AAW0N723_9GOBI